MIEYKTIKTFESSQLSDLFLSVNWQSGDYPDKLKTALQNSSNVISAWDDNHLIGLIRGLDDGIWQATIDCLLVNPMYQGQGIASTLLNQLLATYKTILYINVVPDETKNVSFYKKHGFQVMEEGTPLQYNKKG